MPCQVDVDLAKDAGEGRLFVGSSSSTEDSTLIFCGLQVVMLYLQQCGFDSPSLCHGENTMPPLLVAQKILWIVQWFIQYNFLPQASKCS